MLKEFKGEVAYNKEVDQHFPHLTVRQTLEFAAAVRTPHNRVNNVSRKSYVEHMAEVVMAVFGLSHTRNTKVGDDFVRGVSGGERKRVSIAEMALSGCPIACWDNSTRGLDAATALEFVKSLGCRRTFLESPTLSPFIRHHNKSTKFSIRPLCSMRVTRSTLGLHVLQKLTLKTWDGIVLPDRRPGTSLRLSLILRSEKRGKGLSARYREHRLSLKRTGDNPKSTRQCKRKSKDTRLTSQ